ncbi:MAG: S-(hydroxymethyl)glutathione dehydrogenase [Watsoniomyces obsoletus]|nr:MAG: S-(hydroxymethyl)glutathione dehydrogenase [Watsoniomyces obsoletus]
MSSSDNNSRLIEAWLSTLPSSLPDKETSPGIRKKRPFMAMDPNRSPKRRRVRDGDETTKENEGPLPIDLDITPRPAAGSSSRSILPKPSSSTSPSVSSSSAASKSSQRSSQRSLSPLKRITGTMLRPYPIMNQTFNSCTQELPVGLRQMHRELQEMSEGIGVIDESCRVEIAHEALTNPGFEEIDRDVRFRPCSSSTLCPSVADVNRIFKRAYDAEKSTSSEAHWNCYVHVDLLGLALDRPEFVGHIGHLNCTTACIQPASLIPPRHAGKPGESKMIDFAIYLDPDPLEVEAMRVMADRQPEHVEPTVNPTWYEPLVASPIAIPMETKRTGEGWAEAMVQSGVWMAAHLNKLRALVDDMNDDHETVQKALDTLPGLPFLIVQGHDWVFLAASRGPQDQTYIWSKLTIGSTSSHLGIYRIVSALQYLARWGQKVYRPWFFTYAIPMPSTVQLPIRD